jgi:hypothetical protein
MNTPATAAYKTLATALRERLAVIADRQAYAENPEAHMERLKKASEHITAAVENLPKPISPELAHYIQRASYDKALAWLEAHLN